MLRELQCGSLALTAAWDDVPAALCGELAGVPQGLYVFLFSNDSDVAVYDNNKKRKIVVHRQGTSIKPGKFEQGLAVRLHNYNAHLHRTPPGGPPEWVLRECFKSGYVLDLGGATGAVRSPARIFERYWTEAVNAFLDAHRLLADGPIQQLGRAEWRYLEGRRWTPPVRDAFREYLEEVATRIFQMVDVGRLPSPARKQSSARLGKHASIDEVRRRVERDEERLLRKVARVDRIVPLDDLDPKNAVVSLDRAAAKLVGEGIVEA